MSSNVIPAEPGWLCVTEEGRKPVPVVGWKMSDADAVYPVVIDYTDSPDYLNEPTVVTKWQKFLRPKRAG